MKGLSDVHGEIKYNYYKFIIRISEGYNLQTEMAVKRESWSMNKWVNKAHKMCVFIRINTK